MTLSLSVQPARESQWRSAIVHNAAGRVVATDAPPQKPPVGGAAPRVLTKAEYEKIAPGTEYQDAEGNIRRKGGN